MAMKNEGAYPKDRRLVTDCQTPEEIKTAYENALAVLAGRLGEAKAAILFSVDEEEIFHVSTMGEAQTVFDLARAIAREGPDLLADILAHSTIEQIRPYPPDKGKK